MEKDLANFFFNRALAGLSGEKFAVFTAEFALSRQTGGKPRLPQQVPIPKTTCFALYAETGGVKMVAFTLESEKNHLYLFCEK